MVNTAYIALGSNMNNPESQITQAIQSIRHHPNCTVEKVSPFYHTKPMGYALQDDFVNAVIKIKTTLSPFALLKTLQAIEDAQGRVRGMTNGPRTIDLDISLYGNIIMNTPQLTLPHPGVVSLDFVLIPLLDIEPDISLPNGKKLQDLKSRMSIFIVPQSNHSDDQGLDERKHVKKLNA